MSRDLAQLEAEANDADRAFAEQLAKVSEGLAAKMTRLAEAEDALKRAQTSLNAAAALAEESDVGMAPVRRSKDLETALQRIQQPPALPNGLLDSSVKTDRERRLSISHVLSSSSTTENRRGLS